ncbi:hypothetical protein [Streptomyces sp. NPDC093544]
MLKTQTVQLLFSATIAIAIAIVPVLVLVLGETKGTIDAEHSGSGC